MHQIRVLEDYYNAKAHFKLQHFRNHFLQVGQKNTHVLCVLKYSLSRVFLRSEYPCNPRYKLADIDIVMCSKPFEHVKKANCNVS